VLLSEASKLADLFDWLAERHVDIVHLDTERGDDGRHAIDLVLALPGRMDRIRLTADLEALEWITVDDVGRHPE
jgi:hypothetical protein